MSNLEMLKSAPASDNAHNGGVVLKAWVAPAYQTLDIRDTEATTFICEVNDGFIASGC
jgi:hypothetical protein